MLFEALRIQQEPIFSDIFQYASGAPSKTILCKQAFLRIRKTDKRDAIFCQNLIILLFGDENGWIDGNTRIIVEIISSEHGFNPNSRGRKQSFQTNFVENISLWGFNPNSRGRKQSFILCKGAERAHKSKIFLETKPSIPIIYLVPS